MPRKTADAKIIYKTDRRNALTITIGLGLVWGFAIVYGLCNGVPITNPNIPIGILGWIIISSNFIIGFYGELDRKKRLFSRISWFFWREVLQLDEIKEVRYQPMFWICSYDRSIFVVGIHNGRQVNLYYFSNRNFGEKTLAQIAHDLKEAAPHIKYDAPAEALVKKYFRS